MPIGVIGDPVRNSSFEEGQTVLLWEGGDPVTFSRSLDALNGAGIHSQALDEHRMSMFTGMRRLGSQTQYALLVRAAEFSRASEIVRRTLAEETSAWQPQFLPVFRYDSIDGTSRD